MVNMNNKFLVYKNNDINDLSFFDKENILYEDGCFYDSDITCFGFLSNYKEDTIESIIDKYIENIKEEYHKVYSLISSKEYMDNIVNIMNEYDRLSNIVKKYKRRKIGNPDVYNLTKFIEQHNKEIEYSRFDYKVSSVFYTIYKDDKIWKTKLVEKDINASEIDRKEIMKLAISSYIDEEIIYFKEEISEARSSYNNLINKLNQFLATNEYLFLIKEPIKKDNLIPKIMNIKEFTFIEYAKSNYKCYKINK